ncbi:MAG: hypothetical protein U0798_04865 [Gemmataceae bacterium]
MPFTAQCPNCRSAKFSVPWKKHAQTMTCPKCERPFALVPEDDPLARNTGTAPALPRETVPKDKAPTAVEEATLPIPKIHSRVPTRDPDDHPSLGFDMPLAVALGSLGVVGLAVILGQVPYGRFAAVALTPLAGIASLFSLYGLEKRKWLAWSGMGANGLVFLLMLFAPTWLGVTTWMPPPDPTVNLDGVYAVGKDGSLPVPADWVDASVANWQQVDCRMDITAVRIGPLDPTAKTAEKRKPKALRITLLLTNAGVSRGIECEMKKEPPQEVRLASGSGVVVPLKATESAFKPTTVFPGKTAEFTMVFDVPPDPQGDLTLELPMGWFGNRDAIKFRIPLSMISRR